MCVIIYCFFVYLLLHSVNLMTDLQSILN